MTRKSFRAACLLGGLAVASGCDGILGIYELSDGGLSGSEAGPDADLRDVRAGLSDVAQDRTEIKAADASDSGMRDESGMDSDGRTDTGSSSEADVASEAESADSGVDSTKEVESGPSFEDGGGCETGVTRCVGAVPEMCIADGGWTGGPVTAGQCGAECTPATSPGCDVAVPQSCSASGVLTTSPVTAGQCGAECTPATSSACNGAVPQSCSASGALTMGPVTAGQCGAECTPATSPACNGAVPQSCSASGVLTTSPVTTGKCGAVCTPNQYECGISQIGQECGTLGTWISNGSSDVCGCYAPGRFTAVSGTLALDATTGLTWDRSMRAADTWTDASTICNNAGMRLPTRAEWTAVALLSPSAGTSDGTGGCLLNPAPFDQAAMPTTATDLTCLGDLCNLWTGEPEGGFPGYVYVMQFILPTSGSGGDWIAGSSDDATSGIKHPYRCVE